MTLVLSRAISDCILVCAQGEPSVGFMMQPSLALLSTHSTGSSRADGPNK